MKKYTTKIDLHGNKGQDFYKCPNHKAGKGGCDFWKWGDEYEAYLVLHEILPNLESDNYVESKMHGGMTKRQRRREEGRKCRIWQDCHVVDRSFRCCKANPIGYEARFSYDRISFFSSGHKSHSREVVGMITVMV